MNVSKAACLMLLLISGTGSPATVPAQAPGGSFAPLLFLAGTWKGTGSGDPGSGEGGSTFTFDLDSRIMVRKSWAVLAPKNGEKGGARHEDLMITYLEPTDSRLHAVYFDNEGHVIRYDVVAGKPNTVAFESESSQPGPRYRLDYDLNQSGELTISFSIAPVGQPFKVYTKGTARKDR
jgi:hypothetical protein